MTLLTGPTSKLVTVGALGELVDGTVVFDLAGFGEDTPEVRSPCRPATSAWAAADLDDDVLEVFYLREPAQSIERVLECLSPGNRRLTHWPAGTSAFSLRTALATSIAVMLRDASFCGSSQILMLW